MRLYRPTGVVVARVHGVETIREFLAGGLVTLLLDFPFLIVFLATQDIVSDPIYLSSNKKTASNWCGFYCPIIINIL
jgi:hypothetical protein